VQSLADLEEEQRAWEEAKKTAEQDAKLSQWETGKQYN
jgi:hypothetical protein